MDFHRQGQAKAEGRADGGTCSTKYESVIIFNSEFRCFGFGFVLKMHKREDYKIGVIDCKEPQTMVENPKGMRIHKSKTFKNNNLKH